MKRFSTVTAAIIAAFAGTVSCSGVSLAQEVGEAAKIRNDVTASRGNRRLSVPDSVYSGERVSAGNASHGELRLTDDSKIVVGENSTISLDDFVVSSGGFAGGTVSVAKGAFRFISGNSAKGTFKVRTPLSTIGVRGTTFDVYVEGGNEYVVLFSGQVDVCTSRECETAKRACDIIRISPDRSVEPLPFLKSKNSRDEDEDQFNLLDRQTRFQSRWRAPVLNCHARAAMQQIEAPYSNFQNGQGNADDVDKGYAPEPPSPSYPSTPTGPIGPSCC